MLERQYFGCHLSKPWRYTSLVKVKSLATSARLGDLSYSPTKPAPMTTIFRFFSAKVFVEEKLRRIPPFALEIVLDGIDRDADIILKHGKADGVFLGKSIPAFLSACVVYR